jgi:thiosulfate/3-mercaptopyruvate sulfurtransferase
MIFSTLISVSELLPHIDDPDWAIIDCRFTLTDPQLGEKDYLQAHIPGAVYAHLDRDLCGPILPGRTGRHPLPPINTFVEKLSAWGIDSEVQVITYDDVGGAMAAARLWWMLRWLGHDSVAILDGGWQRWKESGFPVRSGMETRAARRFAAHPRHELAVGSEEVEAMRKRSDSLVLDSRTADRFRGENETIDPVAGHIPGAKSAPYTDILDEEEKLHSREKLRDRFEKLLAGIPTERTAFYCGSGVTAALNVLAVAHAGLGDARLYSGSWSEWITDPNRPVAKGNSSLDK